MVGRTKTLDPRLVRRQCLRCGYDGALLRGGEAARCARCGCDLRKRPARSYLEMEGFLGIATPKPWPDDHQPEVGMVTRWVAFLFLSMVGLVMLIYLSAAAFSV